MPLTKSSKHKVLSSTFAFCLLMLSSPYLLADGHTYIGIFGGGGDAKKVDVRQRGFAFNQLFATDALDVDAKGKSGNFGSAMAGAHLGYEFTVGDYFRPALEFEGFYLRSCSGEKTDYLFNPTLNEHAFVDKLPLRTVTFFADLIFGFKLPCVDWLEPYVGGGIGGGAFWISHAHSEQDSPAEPGINHFNTKTSASTSAFAAQFKTGLRFNISSRWRLFAEYRFLHLASTTYTFGFTQYSTHAPTSNWIVDLDGLNYNLGVIGLEYKF